MVLEGRFRYLAQWTAFLEETHNKPISRDAWTQLLAFVNLTNENPSLEKYDPAGTYRCRPQPTPSLARYFRSLFHYILTLARSRAPQDSWPVVIDSFVDWMRKNGHVPNPST